LAGSVACCSDTTVSGFAQTNTQAVNQSDAQRRLDERAPIWLKAFNVTGIGIAYIENGKIAFPEAFWPASF
jgi:hypothetical protein